MSMNLSPTREQHSLQNRYHNYSQSPQAYGPYHQLFGAPAASAPVVEIQVHDRRSIFYSAQLAAGGRGEQQSSSSPPGLTAAATAALDAFAKLTQIAGTMDAAERAMTSLLARGHDRGTLPGAGQLRGALASGQLNPQISGYPDVGGGSSRGGLSIREGYRGSWGMDEGRGSRWGDPGMISSFPHDLEASAYENENAGMEDIRLRLWAAEGLGEASRSQQSIHTWCEHCQVECTSLQMVEQHYSGQRHKKNLGKANLQQATLQPQMELIQQDFRLREVTAGGVYGNPMGVTAITEASCAVESSRIRMLSPDLHKQKSLDISGPSLKRKMKDIRVENKRLKKAELHRLIAVDPLICDLCNVQSDTRGVLDKHLSSKKHITNLERAKNGEPSKPEVAISLFCDLCYIRCDTRAVLDKHLSGKKHIANLEKMENGDPSKPELVNSLLCDLCNIRCDTREVLEKHLSGKKHSAKLERMKNREPNKPEGAIPLVCDVCKVRCDTKEMLDKHLSGKKHIAKLERMKNRETSNPEVAIPLVCDLCDVRCDTREVLDKHLSGKKHIAKLESKRMNNKEGNHPEVAQCESRGLQVLHPLNPVTETTLYLQDHEQPSCSFGPQSSKVAASQPSQGATTADENNPGIHISELDYKRMDSGEPHQPEVARCKPTGLQALHLPNPVVETSQHHEEPPCS